MYEGMLKIKCPYCGAVIAVNYRKGIENKKVTCPVCKESTLFTNYKPVINKQEEHTEYNKAGEERTVTNELNLKIGSIRGLSDKCKQTFRLKIGRNVIGRKASASKADVQIPVDDLLRLSREHLVIEIKKVEHKGYVHYASLYKERVNLTKINDEVLEFGDCIVLNDGDIIHLPDISFKFEIYDNEGTEF